MLKAMPKNWYSHDFDVHDRAGARVGAVDLSDWSEGAKLDVGGASYKATAASSAEDVAGVVFAATAHVEQHAQNQPAR